MHARAHHHFALGTPGACLLPPQLSWKITMYNIHEHCVYMEEAEHRAQCIAKLFLLSVRQPLGGVRQFHVFNKQYACALQCTGIDMDQEERLSARACVGGDSHARSRCSCRLGLYHYHADQGSSASTHLVPQNFRSRSFFCSAAMALRHSCSPAPRGERGRGVRGGTAQHSKTRERPRPHQQGRDTARARAHAARLTRYARICALQSGFVVEMVVWHLRDASCASPACSLRSAGVPAGVYARPRARACPP
jgi:hypothetical protein